MGKCVGSALALFLLLISEKTLAIREFNNPHLERDRLLHELKRLGPNAQYGGWFFPKGETGVAGQVRTERRANCLAALKDVEEEIEWLEMTPVERERARRGPDPIIVKEATPLSKEETLTKAAMDVNASFEEVWFSGVHTFQGQGHRLGIAPPGLTEFAQHIIKGIPKWTIGHGSISETDFDFRTGEVQDLIPFLEGIARSAKKPIWRPGKNPSEETIRQFDMARTAEKILKVLSTSNATVTRAALFVPKSERGSLEFKMNGEETKKIPRLLIIALEVENPSMLGGKQIVVRSFESKDDRWKESLNAKLKRTR